MTTYRNSAQNGKALIKAAIVELLEAKNGVWLSRSQIEEELGIGSTYKGDNGQPSYQGGFSAMLLSELAGERRLIRQKNAKWLYKSAR